VQGERKAKSKAKICFLALPNRRLFYPKLALEEEKPICRQAGKELKAAGAAMPTS